MTPDSRPSVQPGLGTLLNRERSLILERRKAAGIQTPGQPARDAVGVALSGGGMRSATFCLGLFQGLARHRLIRRIDYLSTVSGGGYFGGFLGRMFTREWAATSTPSQKVIASTDGIRGQRTQQAQEFVDGLPDKAPAPTRIEAALRDNNSPPIRWLREGGNYLTPSGARDGALATAVFTRNWVAVLIVVLTSLLTVFLGGSLLRAVMDSANWFHQYELLLQTWTGDHWWWTPWCPLPFLVLGVAVIPLGMAYWLSQAGDNKQFHVVAAANLLVISFGMLAWRVLPSSSFRYGAMALGLESALALLWIFVMAGWRCYRHGRQHLLPDAPMFCSILLLMSIPCLWRFALSGLLFTGSSWLMPLWAWASLLAIGSFHHLALRTAREGSSDANPRDYIGCWKLREWRAVYGLGMLLVILNSIAVTAATAWTYNPSAHEWLKALIPFLDVWAVISVAAGFYCVSYQVLRKDAQAQTAKQDLTSLGLVSWLRSKTSRYLSGAMIVYGVTQVLVIINTLGQSLYATVCYAGGTRSAASAITGLVGVAGLAPILRLIAVRFGGGKLIEIAPIRITALVGALILTFFLTIATSYVSHGIAWRWDNPVLVEMEDDRAASTGPVALLWTRLDDDWTVVSSKESTEGDAESQDLRTVEDGAGARLYSRYYDRKEVTLDEKNLIRVEPARLHVRPFKPRERMAILDLGLSFTMCLTLTFLFGHTFSFLNLSSFHSLYTARLIRAYQGASNRRRWMRSDASIREIDTQDDIPWYGYAPHKQGGPLHLVNVALNSSVSLETNMESNTSKGLNLCLSPAGLSFGHRHAWNNPEPPDPNKNQLEYRLAYPQAELHDPSQGIRIQSEEADAQILSKHVEAMTLGDWVGISGAAFTTGMGNVGGGGGTTLGTSLICGLFNIRLGYWWRNDFSPSSVVSKDAAFPVHTYLLNEFTGSFTINERDHWYLSDGGHFENTAAYELIRRQVPLIIISDAGADPDGKLDDIANLARRARIDFGAEIEFFTDQDLRDFVHPDLLAATVRGRVRSAGRNEPEASSATAGCLGTIEDLRLRAETPESMPRVNAHATLARVIYPSEVKLLVSHLEDFEAFSSRLIIAKDPISAFLWSKLTAVTQTALHCLSDSVPPSQREATMRLLVKDLNTILRNELLYDAERFGGVPLSAATAALRKGSPESEDLPRLNRLLLSDAYPKELSAVDKQSLLLIVKPGMTDDLPADLLNYQRAQRSFPQETTLDQSFDEAQWESYRKLGEQIATLLFAPRDILPDQPSWHPAQWRGLDQQTGANWEPAQRAESKPSVAHPESARLP